MSGQSNPTLDLTRELIRRASVTPEDAGCQDLIADRLSAAGMTVERIDLEDVKNLYVSHGDSKPSLLFLGHTDVVPTGPLDDWSSPPFEPEIRNGRLYGRGAADMKASVAAMVVAMERFMESHPDHSGKLALLLTSDEEGPALHGVRRVIPIMQDRGLTFDFCLVGEPSSIKTFGDNMRIGRRGSLNMEITINGKQGHAAYPDLANNPIHRGSQSLADLTARQWDEGTEVFPPTSFQITWLESGTGAYNVIPGKLSLKANFRYNPLHDPESLVAQVREVLDRYELDYDLTPHDSGRPFVSVDNALRTAVSESAHREVGIAPHPDTGGGTSDGRFLAPTGCHVVEFGPVNQSIHQTDEWVTVDDLEPLARIYWNVMVDLLSSES